MSVARIPVWRSNSLQAVRKRRIELSICIVLYVSLFLRVLFVLSFSHGWGPILDWAVVTIPTIIGFVAWVIPVKETRTQHKWMLFVGGLVFSGLIYLQQYVTRVAHSEELANLPTKGDIAKLPNA